MQSKLLVWREKRKLSFFLVFICVANSRPNVQRQDFLCFCTEWIKGWKKCHYSRVKRASLDTRQVKQQILPFDSAFYIKEQTRKKPVCYKTSLASSLCQQKCCFATERMRRSLFFMCVFFKQGRGARVCVRVCFFRDRTAHRRVFYSSLLLRA